MLSGHFSCSSEQGNTLNWAGYDVYKKRKTRNYTMETLLIKYVD